MCPLAASIASDRVYDAFLVSALAIALAMLVTFIEKLVLVALYRRVQSLTQSIDERYKSGVGEEYLARLVTASEESATQSKILKDALPNLRKSKYESLIEASRTLRKLEKDGDAIFRSAVSALFHDDTIDAKKLIREREVLDDLEKAIDHCDHVASTLANLSVKHG